MSLSTDRRLLGDICQAYNGFAHSLYSATCPQVWEDSKWRVRNNRQREAAGVRPSPFWESPVCHLPWPVGRPRQQAERRMCRRRTLRPNTSSSSARKRFPTSACRPSTCSTRRALRQPRSATSSPGVAGVVVAGAAVAVAAGEPAAAVVAAAVADGVGREAVAAPARLDDVSATSIDTGRMAGFGVTRPGLCHLFSSDLVPTDPPPAIAA
jgi:hypothetical protein